MAKERDAAPHALSPVVSEFDATAMPRGGAGAALPADTALHMSATPHLAIAGGSTTASGSGSGMMTETHRDIVVSSHVESEGNDFTPPSGTGDGSQQQALLVRGRAQAGSAVAATTTLPGTAPTHTSSSSGRSRVASKGRTPARSPALLAPISVAGKYRTLEYGRGQAGTDSPVALGAAGAARRSTEGSPSAGSASGPSSDPASTPGVILSAGTGQQPSSASSPSSAAGRRELVTATQLGARAPPPFTVPFTHATSAGGTAPPAPSIVRIDPAADDAWLPAATTAAAMATVRPDGDRGSVWASQHGSVQAPDGDPTDALPFAPFDGTTYDITLKRGLALGEDVAWVRLAVIDNGCGVSPADQAKLFAPFMQVGDSSMVAIYAVPRFTHPQLPHRADRRRRQPSWQGHGSGTVHLQAGEGATGAIASGLQCRRIRVRIGRARADIGATWRANRHSERRGRRGVLLHRRAAAVPAAIPPSQRRHVHQHPRRAVC